MTRLFANEKIHRIVSLSCVIALALCMALSCTGCSLYSPVSVAGLQEYFESGNTRTVLLRAFGLKEYELIGTVEEMLQMDDWVRNNIYSMPDDEACLVTVMLEDGYGIELYVSYVRVYNDNAGFLQPKQAYYVIPDNVTDDMAFFLAKLQETDTL